MTLALCNFCLTATANALVCYLLQKVVVDTSSFLLGLTAVVTVLHTIFDVLAFSEGTSFVPPLLCL